jgi:uroporphyrinogen decarboxylase
MAGLTGIEYMLNALRGVFSDRVPVTLLVGPYCARFAGVPLKTFLTDPAASAQAQVAFYERFLPDSLIVVNDVYLESEALGCTLSFPDDGLSHIQGRPLKDRAALARIEVPDPGSSGRLPYYLDVCRQVARALPGVAVVGTQAGPWNLAVNLRGFQDLILDTVRDPSFVHDLMKLATASVQSFGDALLSAGISPAMHEASASCSLISPRIYREFVQPYHRELREHARAKRMFLSLHICGRIDPMAEEVIDTGLTPLSVDSPTSLTNLIDRLGDRKTALMGNVRTSLFAEGTREEMEADIRRCIHEAAGRGRFILASGCEIPVNATEDRIDHYFDYARSYGRTFLSKLREDAPGRFS